MKFGWINALINGCVVNRVEWMNEYDCVYRWKNVRKEDKMSE